MIFDINNDIKQENKKMRIIKVGNTFRTYDDSLETFDKLPAQNYVVRFQKNSGSF